MNEREKCKAVVLGLGPRGLDLCDALREVDGFDLAAAFTRNHHRGIRLSRELDLPVYTDWHDMMASQRPEAVFIAVPIRKHHEITMTALERGIGVFLESPPVIKTKALNGLHQAAEETGKALVISQQELFCENRSDFEVLLRNRASGPPLVLHVGASSALFGSPSDVPDKAAFLAACLPLMNLLVASGLEVEGGRVGLHDNGPVLELAFRSGERWRVEFVEDDTRPSFLAALEEGIRLEPGRESLRGMLERSLEAFRGVGAMPLDVPAQIAALELAGRAMSDWLQARKKGITL